MAKAYVEDEIKDDISEKDLLLEEDRTKNTIIRNANYKDSSTDSKSRKKDEKKKPEPKGEKEKGEKEKQKVEDEEEEEPPADRSKPEDNNYRIFNLCRTGQCSSHFSCHDSDRINNLLQVRRRYNITELILKIFTMTILLSCTAIVFYSYGKARGEIEERQEALMLKAFNVSVTTESTSIIKTKVIDPIYNDDEDMDDTIVNIKGLTKGKHGPIKGEQGQDYVDQDDFTFEDSDKEKDDKPKDNEDDTTTFKPIVISFWLR